MDYAVDIKSWDEIAKNIQTKNKTVFDLIAPGMTKADKFMIVNYPFGANLLRSGQLCLPSNTGEIESYEPDKIPSKLKNLIAENYSLFPFGFLNEGYLEVYWNTMEKIIPRGYVKAGSLFGTRVFGYSPNLYNFKHAWSVSSGARSLCLLPRIRDIEKFKRLKATYQIKTDLPNKFKDQWSLFREIYHYTKPSWNSEVIYFSSQTINKMKTGKAFDAFRNWLYKQVSEGTNFDRNQASFDFVWEQFIRFIESKGFKEKAHIYNVAKHLILVAIGEEFGFIPTATNSVAPLDLLTDVFKNNYKTNYYPNFIHASKLNFNKPGDSVYYSLQNPIHLDPFPEKESTTSDLDDLRSIKLVHDKFFEYINSKAGEYVRDTIIADIPNNISFEYFHTVKDRLKVTSHSKEIIDSDSRFTATLTEGKTNNLPFCYSSTIFKGCIRVKCGNESRKT